MSGQRVSSFAGLADGLHEIITSIEAAAAALPDPGLRPLRTYKWRPVGTQVELPALYLELEASTMEPLDTIVDVDHLTVSLRLVVRYTDQDEEMDELVQYADIARSVIDRALKHNDGPLGGARAQRLGVRPVVDQFNEINVRGLDFPVRTELEGENPQQF